MTPKQPPPTAHRSRLRIAIIYPFFAHYRGAVLRELMDRGAHDYFLVGDARDPRGGIETLDLSQHDRFLTARCIHLPWGPMWQQRIVGFAAAARFDAYIFLGNAAWPATWLAAMIARLRRRKVYFWTHGWTSLDRGVRKLMRLTFYRLAHGLLLYGHCARALGKQLGFPERRMHVIYNSLDFAQQQTVLSAISLADRVAMRQRLFGDSHVPVVIAIARLTRIKRFDLLIEAVAALARDGHKVNVLIVGDGPEKAALQARAEQAGVVARFYGACYAETDLGRLFTMANVTVSPGNVGLTCMHSLGYGVPVITHGDASDQMPEWEAIVPGRNGELFDKGSALSLAAAIRHWTQTPMTSAAVSERCVASIAQNFNPVRQRELIEQVIAFDRADPVRPVRKDEAMSTADQIS